MRRKTQMSTMLAVGFLGVVLVFLVAWVVAMLSSR